MLSFGEASDALRQDDGFDVDFYDLCVEKIIPIIKLSMVSVR